VLFENIDEDPILLATTSAALNQANILNNSLLNERVVEEESENKKLKDKNIGLKEEIRKIRKVYGHLIPLKENILEE
jgi:cell division protein FtsB